MEVKPGGRSKFSVVDEAEAAADTLEDSFREGFRQDNFLRGRIHGLYEREEENAMRGIDRPSAVQGSGGNAGERRL